MSKATSETAVARAVQAAFGKPLVTNVIRGLLVEAIIADALSGGWTWCSADYASWDFEHEDGTRLEVKQSASWQTWAQEGSRPSSCSFDIGARTGRYEAGAWIKQTKRAADIYVFGHHPVLGEDADHRDPRQWVFYVAATANLPATKRISLAAAKAVAIAVGVKDLAAAVDEVRASIGPAR